jgi:hypothetical protein
VKELSAIVGSLKDDISHSESGLIRILSIPRKYQGGVPYKETINTTNCGPHVHVQEE